MAQPAPKVSPWIAALLLRCPRCGKGKIYKSFLKTASTCKHCGFNIKKHDAADGPAFFGITFIGILTAVLAVFVEIKYEPSLLVHALLWLPFIIFGSIFSLIIFKSLFIAAQFAFKVGAYEDKKKAKRHGKK